MTVYLGIDIGIGGAIASKDTEALGGKWAIQDIPTYGLEKTNGGIMTVYKITELNEIFKPFGELRKQGVKVLAGFEKLRPVGGFKPQQGQAKASISGSPMSNFNLGGGWYLMQALCIMNEIPFVDFAPQKWKNCGVLQGLVNKSDKEAIRLRCMQTHPELALQLKRKMDHNRAEAVFIAEYVEKNENILF